MKISTTPTNHLLIRAYTCSDWDDCDYAVINCDRAWRERMASRLEAAARFNPDGSFLSFHYTDQSARFYISREENFFDELPENGVPLFIELEEGEEASFKTPGTCMDGGRIVIHRNGRAYYVRHAENTRDEFFTGSFSVPDILERLYAEDNPYMV